MDRVCPFNLGWFLLASNGPILCGKCLVQLKATWSIFACSIGHHFWRKHAIFVFFTNSEDFFAFLYGFWNLCQIFCGKLHWISKGNPCFLTNWRSEKDDFHSTNEFLSSSRSYGSPKQEHNYRWDVADFAKKFFPPCYRRFSESVTSVHYFHGFFWQIQSVFVNSTVSTSHFRSTDLVLQAINQLSIRLILFQTHPGCPKTAKSSLNKLDRISVHLFLEHPSSFSHLKWVFGRKRMVRPDKALLMVTETGVQISEKVFPEKF